MSILLLFCIIVVLPALEKVSVLTLEKSPGFPGHKPSSIGVNQRTELELTQNVEHASLKNDY
jgi:hypothetical protein